MTTALLPEEIVNTGVPWWAVIIIAVFTSLITGGGTIATVWVSRKKDKATSEQVMIDQLQEQVATLRADLNALQGDVRNLRVREIAWITYTANLVHIITAAGQTAPPLPPDLANPDQEAITQ